MMRLTASTFLNTGSLFLALLYAGGATAQTCPQLQPEHRFVLVRGENTLPDGKTQPVATCISRQNAVATIDTLGDDGKVLMRARYQGHKALSHENLKRNLVSETRYSDDGQSVLHAKSGQTLKYSVKTLVPGKADAELHVTHVIGDASTTMISGCELAILAERRQNVETTGRVTAYQLSYAPALNWPVYSQSTALNRSVDGPKLTPGPVFRLLEISPADEAQRVCEAAQTP
ncbi:MAG: hypothetical protein CFE31_18590 [Rhizobiales bacterium PAR1]|nr:MAG: hypothetical protein CFE31_18590 [Rhizobiales bacterium PAR1]